MTDMSLFRRTVPGEFEVCVLKDSLVQSEAKLYIECYETDETHDIALKKNDSDTIKLAIPYCIPEKFTKSELEKRIIKCLETIVATKTRTVAVNIDAVKTWNTTGFVYTLLKCFHDYAHTNPKWAYLRLTLCSTQQQVCESAKKACAELLSMLNDNASEDAEQALYSANDFDPSKKTNIGGIKDPSDNTNVYTKEEKGFMTGSSTQRQAEDSIRSPKTDSSRSSKAGGSGAKPGGLSSNTEKSPHQHFVNKKTEINSLAKALIQQTWNMRPIQHVNIGAPGHAKSSDARSEINENSMFQDQMSKSQMRKQSNDSSPTNNLKENVPMFETNDNQAANGNNMQPTDPVLNKTDRRETTPPHISSSGGDMHSLGMEQSKEPMPGPDDNCVICMDKLKNPKMLKCGHVFCSDCIDQQFVYKEACPACGTVHGVIKGDQPDGTMELRINEREHCAGFDRCGRIEINYNFCDGTQTSSHPNPGKPYKGIRRTAYLPNNSRGRKIAEMLHVAFERKLVFTIGSSRTTGKEDVITWNNIHHKTDHRPHSQFGYPDATYLDRVTEELKVKGITEDDISSKRR